MDAQVGLSVLWTPETKALDDSLVITDPTFKQRSQGWLDLRSCLQTASAFGVLLSDKIVKPANNFKKMQDYYAEIQGHWLQGEDATARPLPSEGAKATMEFGTNMEPFALQDYRLLLHDAYDNQHADRYCRIEMTFPEFFIEKTGMRAASPDGAVRVTYYRRTDDALDPDLTEYGLVEFKAPTGGLFFRNPTRSVFVPLSMAEIENAKKRPRNTDAQEAPNWPWRSGRWSTIQERDIDTTIVAGAGVPVRKRHFENRTATTRKAWFRGDKNCALQAYYYQCIGQLFLAPSKYAWVDFFPWVGSAANKTKPFQIQRLYKDDRQVIRDWEECEKTLNSEYTANMDIYTSNIRSFIAKYGQSFPLDDCSTFADQEPREDQQSEVPE